MVSGYDLEFTLDGTRWGRFIVPKSIVKSAPASVRNARERSQAVRGARILIKLTCSDLTCPNLSCPVPTRPIPT